MVLLFDLYNMPDDIYKVAFPTERQQIVAKLLIKKMKENEGIMNKTEMSLFATHLAEGTLVDDRDEVKIRFGAKKPTLSYNKRQFYDRILTPLKSMGMIGFNLYDKNYKISDKFNRQMIKIGLLWLREIKN